MITHNTPTSIKLTIVIATFNASRTLKSALESVLNLTYNDWECIIVDGLSNDETLHIIESYEQKDNRFHHISEKDNGVYDAFNKGWKEAQGEWIYYLGADDTLFATGLEKLMNVAKKVNPDVGVVSGGVIRVSQNGSQRKMITKGYIGSHQSMVMKRSVLEQMNGFDLNYQILADFDLFIRLKNSKYKVTNTDIIIAYFHAGGMSEKFKYTFRIFHEKLKILHKDKYSKFPFIITLYDTSRTILGGIYHRLRWL